MSVRLLRAEVKECERSESSRESGLSHRGRGTGAVSSVGVVGFVFPLLGPHTGCRATPRSRRSLGFPRMISDRLLDIPGFPCFDFERVTECFSFALH